MKEKLRALLDADYGWLQYLLNKLRNLHTRRHHFWPVYPHENQVGFDPYTEKILSEMRLVIPACNRGDNPAFKSTWDTVFERDEIGHDIIQKIESIVPNKFDPPHPRHLESLKTVGYTSLKEKAFSKEKVVSVLDYLVQHRVYPSWVVWHSTHRPISISSAKDKGYAFGTYDLGTILKAPFLAQFIADKEFIALVAHSFGCLPTICSINLYWSFFYPNASPQGPQNYHRDVDDFRIINTFMNFTDTDSNDGGYCHIDKTHTCDGLSAIFHENKGKSDALLRDLNPFNHPLEPEYFFTLPGNGYGFDDLYEDCFHAHVHDIYGEAGSVRMADGYGLHHAVKPTSQDRLLLWITFSLTSTSQLVASTKPQKRIPYAVVRDEFDDDQVSRYVLRNIVDFT